MDTVVGIIVIAIWAGLIYATVRVAGGKGRNPYGWAVLALLVPLIALIVILVLPPAAPRAAR